VVWRGSTWSSSSFSDEFLRRKTYEKIFEAGFFNKGGFLSIWSRGVVTPLLAGRGGMDKEHNHVITSSSK
jgi:hypothetical protein